jgi:hypothetical protein
VKVWASMLAACLSVAVSACSASTRLPSNEPTVVVNDRTKAGAKKADQNQHASEEFISAEMARKLAQEYDARVSWRATLEAGMFFREENGQKIPRPTWRVEAIYPAGNRVIIYFDAVTAERLEVFEAPAGTPPSEGK